jgi:hypothetical protein
MIAVGGALDPSLYAVETTGNLPDLATLKCDTNEGVTLFDLTELKWGSLFNASAGLYKVPKQVYDVIGGS